MPFEIPILFLIFNRPDTTEKVFQEIRKQQPKYLYIAADGPRVNRPDDVEKCSLTRAIIQQIDWDCDLKLLFRDENIGFGKAVYTAITWFFDQVEMGITLEDDCLPHPDFFPYCEELLIKYKNNETIKWIAGSNYNFFNNDTNYSYIFSKYPFVTGWASWKRVWSDYHYDINVFSKKEMYKKIDENFSTLGERLYWKNRFEIIRNPKIAKKRGISAWDYQNLFSIWMKDGLTIIPQKNLVTHIGIGPDATHVSSSDMSFPSFPILPLIHNETINQNKKVDLLYYKKMIYKPLWKYPLLWIKTWLEKVM